MNTVAHIERQDAVLASRSECLVDGPEPIADRLRASRGLVFGMILAAAFWTIVAVTIAWIV